MMEDWIWAIIFAVWGFFMYRILTYPLRVKRRERRRLP